MLTIDAAMLKSMFLTGTKLLESRKDIINELNVFPVPDGDTGTNMTLTALSAARDVAVYENPKLEEIAKAISSGSLRGARGNSGVILSQLFRGFGKVIEKEHEVTVPVLSKALQKGAETAYHAVMKPKEGTILTVAKAGAQAAVRMEKRTDDIIVFMETVLEEMKEALSKTPELLPVLKEANVVDSGGEGLVTIVQGWVMALKGEDHTLAELEVTKPKKSIVKLRTEEEITFGYCTEFIILLKGEDGTKQSEKDAESVEKELKERLPKEGDSLVVVSDEDIVKVHIHTNHPGKVIEQALGYGALSHLKIDNMRLEHQETLITGNEEKKSGEPVPVTKEFGFVSVVAGKGLTEIFKDLGADYIIEGGQTMNPSTEDIIQAVYRVPANTIYILPNNKNIILAAQQAKELVTDRELVIIPTVTIPQGITALINYLYDEPVEKNVKVMTEEIGHIRSGQVTYAVRDTILDGREIHQGDYMGIADGVIESITREPEAAVRELVEHMLQKGGDILSVYYGEGVKEETAASLLSELEAEYPKLDVQMLSGGQPVYSYLLSVE